MLVRVQLSNRKCYSCHFQRLESWRQLHPKRFRSSYWIALQSPLAISQNARNHFSYVALHALFVRFVCAYVRTFNGLEGCFLIMIVIQRIFDYMPVSIRVKCFAVVNVIRVVICPKMIHPDFTLLECLPLPVDYRAIIFVQLANALDKNIFG